MKTPKKTIVLVAASILIGSVLGGGATYVVLHNKDKETTRIPFVASSNPEPQATSAETIKPIKRDSKLPEGTVSPHAIALKPSDYKGKQIKVRGLVTESSPGQYNIVGQTSEENLGVRLDFSKSKVDAAKYANISSTNPPKTADPVTITGTLVQSKNAQGNIIYILSVESLTN